MSGKSYAYTQLGLSFLQDTCYKYSSKVVEMVMTQLSLKAALNQWGKDAKVMGRPKQSSSTGENPLSQFTGRMSTRRSGSKSFVFVKKKQSGQIKARKVAGGNKQRDFISKENASSPTVATESVLQES
jgi:hypothetical protein